MNQNEIVALKCLDEEIEKLDRSIEWFNKFGNFGRPEDLAQQSIRIMKRDNFKMLKLKILDEIGV